MSAIPHVTLKIAYKVNLQEGDEMLVSSVLKWSKAHCDIKGYFED